MRKLRRTWYFKTNDHQPPNLTEGLMGEPLPLWQAILGWISVPIIIAFVVLIFVGLYLGLKDMAGL